jgi:hypothetical protein
MGGLCFCAGFFDALGKLKERGHATEDDDLVFCNTAGDYLDSWALRRRFYAAITRAGLRRIRFHDLRHAFGTAAIGVLDAYRVQSYMGHQHYSTTQRYLHHKPRPEDAARLARAFGESEQDDDERANGHGGGVARGLRQLAQTTARQSEMGHSRHRPTAAA